MWMQVCLRVHAVLCGLVGEPQFQPTVDAGFGGRVGIRRPDLGGGQVADGAFEPVRGEDVPQPAVDGGQELFFADVDVDGVGYVAGQGVFLAVAAAVVGALVVVLGLHPPPADAAV